MTPTNSRKSPTPSGRTVDYIRDALGRIETVTTTINGNTETLASNIGYEPFGPVTGLDYHNGINRDNDYDPAYRLTALSSAVLA